MKKATVFKIVGIVVALLAVAAFYFFPEISGTLAGGLGVTQAMGFITAGTEYHGKENMEINIRPRFLGTAPSQMGIRSIDTQGASSYKLTFFGKIAKVLMPYVAGFQGGSGATKVQKKVTLSEFKAEAAYDKHDYANTILEQIVNSGVNQNDISGTDVMKAEQAVFFDAVQADVFANFWLGDTTKTHINGGVYPDGSTTYAAGDADKFYNNIDGILKKIKDNIYQTYVTKQVAITGWNKTTYPTLYLAESGGQVYAFESAAKRTGAASGDRLFHFAATNSTYPYTAALTADNTSGFGGSVSLLKACTGGSFELKATYKDYIFKIDLPTLTTDTAETYMNKLVRYCTPELKALKDAGLLRFYVTNTVLHNYEDTLKGGTTETARTAMIDGVQRYACDGIPIIPMNIDALIEEDFAATFPKDWIILTTPQNLCLVINGSSNFSETRFWFNPDENENRQRTQFEFGADFILPELIAVAYPA